MTKKKTFTTADFRAELVKVMPGYDWTVHRQFSAALDQMEATGTRSSGMNRLSTLHVTRTEYSGVKYWVKSAGFGRRAPWLHTNADVTIKSALRGLQRHYETQAGLYRGHAEALQIGRIEPSETAS